MGDDVLNLSRRERGEDGHWHRPVCSDSHKGDSPAGTALAAECHTVTTLYAILSEQIVAIADGMGYFGIGERVTLVVGKCFRLPLVADTLLYQMDK